MVLEKTHSLILINDSDNTYLSDKGLLVEIENLSLEF